MEFWTAFYAISFYFATFILVFGLGYKIFQYAVTPAPLKIPTTPAPVTTGGVVVRLLLEVVIFKSLFRSNKWIWLFAMMFHLALWIVLIRHLRYFMDPVWTLVVLAQPFGKYASFAMLFGLFGLLARRMFVVRINYISVPSDYLMLFLLLAIGISGTLISFVTRTDIIQFKAFMLSVLCLDWTNLQTMPTDTMLLIHLTAVILLMIVFPFSKLLHVPGIFFAPTRNQVDNAREKRHVAPWAVKEFETSPASTTSK
ncbi:MAG: respiratory nitrate reductase subunit gamma [Candidatus Marithrix sp.]|nr:respiratory nitrate reductase subunit gamma [Candidatus Marithrix sp.]